MIRIAVALALVACQHPASSEITVDGSPGVDDDAGGVLACDVVASTGPRGRLAGFAIAANGAQWLLTREVDGVETTLWERRDDDTWKQRPFGVTCRDGVLAPDRAAVACSVPSETLADFDVRLFVVGPQSVTSRRVAAAAPGLGETIGGTPRALAYDASGRANLVWLTTSNGAVHLNGSSYQLSQDRGGSWDTGHIWPYGGGNYLTNLQPRLVRRGGEMFFAIAVRQTSIEVSRLDGERLFSVNATTARASSFAEDYELAPDPLVEGAWHVVFSDTSSYDDLSAAGYVAYHHVVAGSSGERVFLDGPHPIRDHPAGLSGVAFALDPNGDPIASFDGRSGTALRLARSRFEVWDLDDAAVQRDVGRTELAFDAGGQLHLAFEDLGAGTIELRDERCAP